MKPFALMSTLLLGLTLLLPLSPVSADPGSRLEKSNSVILAGGCFWCIESDYEKKVDGILDVVSGYSGGHTKNPTYKEVSAGGTGHLEVVKVTYDPSVISYTEILDFFWRHVDPTRNDGQFCDGGDQYRPVIFYADEEEQRLAKASKANIEKVKPFSSPIKVELLPRAEFYLAEDYHQDYYKKNPLRYRYYRFACGRDARVEELWGEENN